MKTFIKFNKIFRVDAIIPTRYLEINIICKTIFINKSEDNVFT